MNKHLQTVLKLLAVIPLLLVYSSGIAQHTVTGRVIDSSNGETLPGVNILVSGTTQGTSTDASGMYELSTPSSSDTLVFSFIGYATQTVPVNGRSQIDIELVPQAFLTDELVVVGYGTQRREDVTSAVSSVRSEEFLTASPKDATSLIKGKVAGLTISAPTGNPTEGTEIRLRGATTLTASTDPLVLIDGVPGSLNTVAPENIESISVLKDGSAAAIYGARGSNGVIQITTKKHEGFRPPAITYQGYVNIQQITAQPEFMNGDEYRRAIQEQDFPATDYGNSTDWQDLILRNGSGHNHSLSLSGGDVSTNYLASLSYRASEGIFIRSDNEDIRGRINIRHSMFDDRLNATMSLNYRTQNYFDGSNSPFESFNTNAWYQAMIRNPTDQIRDEEGNYQERPGFNYYNPLAIINEANGDTEVRDLRVNGTLAWKPVDNLSLQVLGSSSRFTEVAGYSETFDHFSTTFNNFNGFASRRTEADTDNLFEFTGNYQNSINAHSFNLLGGYSYQEVSEEDFYLDNRDFPTDLFTYNSVESGSGLQDGLATLGSGKTSYKLIGFFSRVNYDYDNRYILMGSVRYEGNSRFGADHKWGWFPAVSAGWRISEESFMSEVDFVDDLKLRAGFGVTGISPDESNLSLASYEFGDFFYNGGEWVRGYEPSRNPNPDLKWERKEEINLGLDFTVLDNRLNGSVDLYRRNTKDLLFEYAVPSPPFLYDEILANVGEMKNEGIEVALDYLAVQSRDFTWRTSANYSTNRNELVTLSNDLYQTDNNYIDAGGLGESVQLPTHRIFVGGEVGNFFGYKVVDIDEGGGWIVENEEGERKSYFEIDEGDRQVLGNGLPDHNLAWNNTFRYKNFDLSVYMRGAFGFQILNETRLFYENPTQNGLNLLKSAFDPVFGKRVLNNEWQYMSYYIEDGDYVKIDNITLGYNFDITQIEFISSARIYVSGQNLHTFTKYKGLDPEVSISGLAPGHDYRNRYPTTRTFTLGVNLTF